MAINPTDVQIMRPERVTDETDGGGMMTGVAIASGDINNLWDDIPRTMLAYGGVSLRKLFCAIRSANVDKFLGAHAMLASDAAAPNVSTLLFSTGDHYDERNSAQDKIEQFVVLGTRSGLRPVGTQREGQTALVLYGDKETDAPEVGAVMYLIAPGKSQPVKITKVGDIALTTFTYLDKDGNYQTFRAYQMVLSISQPLQYDFPGNDPAPYTQHATEIFNTQSNNSAKYYGIKPLAQAATAGDRAVVVDGIFAPIVPAATTEQAIVDQTPGIAQRTVQPTGAAQTRNLGTVSGPQTFTLPTAWVPGSLRLTVGASVYAENGNGLRLLSGSDYVTDAVVTPTDGVLAFTVSGSRSVSVEYQPGVALELTPYTKSVEISAGNRQITYTEQLQPPPMPGSVRVEFAYLGRWYVVTDNGTGVLAGNGASGTINYTTGSVALTLPGEPDMGSRIIYTWAQSSFTTLASGARDVYLGIDLDGNPAAGTAVVSWQRGSNSYTASAGADNSLAGGADGYLQGSRLLFRSANLPSGPVTVNYQRQLAGERLTSNLAVAQQTGGTITLNTGIPNLRPETVFFTLNATWTVTTNVAGTISTTRLRRTLIFQGNANGQLMLSTGGPVRGSIAASTGVITISADALQVVVQEWVLPSQVLQNWQMVTVTKPMRIESQTAAVKFYTSNATEAASVTVPFEELKLVAQLTDRPLVPAALHLRVGGDDLVDRGDGYLYRGWNAGTGAGIQCGTLNYAGGDVEINYSALQPHISNLNSSLLAGADGVGAAAAVVSVVFRSVASPLRPSGLQFLARRATDGALMRAVSDNDGVITGSFDTGDTVSSLPQPGSVNGYSLPFVPTPTTGGAASGVVDYSTGVVSIEFTQPVILTTLTYNAVTYTTVPLSPEVLGLNPVRLPTNGRVPVFQPGYLVVIHNTQSIALATPTAGQAIDCGRENLAQVHIRDAAGVDLDPAMYSVNKATGIITLADPFTAQDEQTNSLTMPLTVTHRQEDMAAVGTVSVDGTLQLLTSLRNSYSAGDTFVSAAVNFGTLQARVRNLFDESSDPGWFDARQGSEATATYDALNYPVLVDNRSAVQERWKLKFTSSTGFQVIGEKLGIIGTGSINADYSPINPMTSEPYFTIRAAGWGGGWVTSNILRFNTDAAAAPLWAIRTVLPDSEPLADDVISVEFRGDAD